MRPRLLSGLFLLLFSVVLSGSASSSERHLHGHPKNGVAPLHQIPGATLGPGAWLLPLVRAQVRKAITEPSNVNARAFADGSAEVFVQCGGKDDTTALIAAVKTADGRSVVIAGGQTCASSDITIPHLRIEKGGLLKPKIGQTITLTGSFEAGTYETFTNILPGQGTILFHKAPVTGDGQTGIVQAYPQWWGCIADYMHDCAPALTAAINSGARRIFLPGGGYGLASPVTITSNNFILEGDSRVYTDVLPLAVDIHVGSGPNAMFINAQNITNCIIQKIRFTSLIGFAGWAIWAEDDVKGGQALFSSNINHCWISMGIGSTGFFHGGFTGSTFAENEIENTNTIFDLRGAGNAGSAFINNRLVSCNGSFITSITTPSNEMMVRGLQVFSQLRGDIIDLKGGTDWQISNVSLNYYGTVGFAGGLINFDTCTGVLLSNFYASRGSGNMAGILIKDSEVKISNGYLSNVNGTEAVRYPILIRGTANDVDITNVTVDTSDAEQVYFDNRSGGNIRFSHCKFNKGSSRIFNSGSGVTANIDIRDSTIINGQYRSRVSKEALVELSTSGRLFIINNVIGVDDKLATPVADLAFNGSGDALIDGNTFIGTATVPVFAGGSAQAVRVGRNYGYATSFYAAAMPTSGSWTAGDVVHAIDPVEAGTRGSKYVISGWIRVTTGSGNVLNTDWLQMRSLTGN